MGTTNPHRTWGSKPRLFGENSDNRNRRGDGKPCKGSDQTNARIHSPVVELKKLFSLIWGEYKRQASRSKSVLHKARMLNFICPPDLIALYFFFWGHLKLLVYDPGGYSGNLMARIVVASADIASTQDLFERF
ncbi:hypothetical protein TNCV_2782261 [Trichonephila clavipes]|nr:hypothetical protein TNCV_2782261 [Trichonephila clavipes]